MYSALPGSINYKGGVKNSTGAFEGGAAGTRRERRAAEIPQTGKHPALSADKGSFLPSVSKSLNLFTGGSGPCC